MSEMLTFVAPLYCRNTLLEQENQTGDYFFGFECNFDVLWGGLWQQIMQPSWINVSAEDLIGGHGYTF